MKISLQWLKQYIHYTQSPAAIADLLTHSGLESTLQTWQPIKGNWQGLIVGKIISCMPHPNADRLKIVTVDVGDEQLSIICGASNVALHQKVVVAPMGTILYTTEGKPWKIKKTKIRGIDSYGMLCSAEEIGYPKAVELFSQGILILPAMCIQGTPLKEYLSIPSDIVLSIETTPNRADALSHIGIARELAALLDCTHKLPDKKTLSVVTSTDSMPYTIVTHTKACVRLASMLVRMDILSKQIPLWLQNYLHAIDVYPSNILSAVLSFVLYEIGQPLFVLDMTAIQGEMVVKQAQENTIFVTSQGQKIVLTGQEYVIVDDHGPILLIGIDIHTRVQITDQTKQMLVLSYYIPAVLAQHTLQKHTVHTPERYRYARGTDPDTVVMALERVAYLLEKFASVVIDQPVVDIYSTPVPDRTITIAYQYIQDTIGDKLPKATIQHILQKLEMTIEAEDFYGCTVRVPLYRVDILRPIDIIEEIMRIIGYHYFDPLPAIAMQHTPIPHVISQYDRIQNQIKRLFVSSGYYEVYTHAFTHRKYAMCTDQKPIEVSNPLSDVFDFLKTDLLFGGLEVLAWNVHRQQKDVKIFEIGKVYNQNQEKYTENKRLGLWITGRSKEKSWDHTSKLVCWKDLKQMVFKVLHYTLGDHTYEEEMIFDSAYYTNPSLKIMYRGQAVVFLGRVESTFVEKFQIETPVFYAHFDWDLMLTLHTRSASNCFYQQISKYPWVKRDLSIIISKDLAFATIQKYLYQTQHMYCKKFKVVDIYQGKPLLDDQKVYTLSFILQAKDRTLEEKIIEKIMQEIMQGLTQKFGAIIRTA